MESYNKKQINEAGNLRLKPQSRCCSSSHRGTLCPTKTPKETAYNGRHVRADFQITKYKLFPHNN